MTRDEATNLLYQYKYFFENRRKRSRYTEQFAKALGIAIKSLSTENEWIPCSERLPEIYIPVILSGKYNEVVGYRRNDSDWMALTGDGWETDIEHPEDFIAWMPLPKPYEKTNV